MQQQREIPDRLWPTWDRCLGLVGLALLVVHGLVAASMAVDVPHADEWELLRAGALDSKPNWAWLWSPHNEHRLVFTKLLTWLLYRCANWHLPTQAALNFVGYAALCGMLLRFMRRSLRAPGSFLWVPLASVILWEIHYWSFQSHFHLYILFFAAALGALRSPGRQRFLATPLAACSLMSFSSGLVCAAAVAVAAVVMGRLRPAQRHGYWAQALLIMLACAAWFLPSPPPTANSLHALPISRDFWVHLGSTWARGFGINQLTPWNVGLAIIATSLGLGVQQARRLRHAPSADREAWMVGATFGLAMLTCTALVSFGRGSVPGMTRFIAPRYLENVLLTMPLVWALLWHNLPRRPALRVAMSLCLVLPFLDDLNARHTYRREHTKQVTLRACTDAYYRGEHGGQCPSEMLFRNGDLTEVLDRARALRLSFTEVGCAQHPLTTARQGPDKR